MKKLISNNVERYRKLQKSLFTRQLLSHPILIRRQRLEHLYSYYSLSLSKGKGILLSSSIMLLTNSQTIKAQCLNKVGAEFRVNEIVEGNQICFSADMSSNGNFVITWFNIIEDSISTKGYFKTYNQDGMIIQPELRVNEIPSANQSYTEVAMDDDGDFTVIWAEYLNDGYNIYGRRYNALGEPKGAAFKINETPSSEQLVPSIDMDADGDFVVLWHEYLDDNISSPLFGKVYNNDGTELSSEFIITDKAYNYYYSLGNKVTMDKEGDFTVVWLEKDSLNLNNTYVYVQQFSKNGDPAWEALRVNQEVGYTAISPTVDCNPDGDFAVSWMGYDEVEDKIALYLKKYNNNGSPQGDIIDVVKFDDYFTYQSSVTIDKEGDILIAWDQYEDRSTEVNVYAKFYSATEDCDSNPQLVSTETENIQTFPTIATDDDGNFVVVWNSYFQDNYYFGVYAQRYSKVLVNTTQIIEEENNLSLFPNPTQEVLHVTFSATDKQIAEILIQDVNGRILKSERPIADRGSNELKMDLNELPSGTYFLRIQMEESIKQSKFLKF